MRELGLVEDGLERVLADLVRNDLVRNDLALQDLIPSLGVHQNDTQGEAPHRSTGWQSKTRNKLLWRGGPAVDVSSNALDKTRRTKLAAIAGASEGERDVLVDRGGEWKKEAWGVKRLNERYMDVDFADSNSQV
jgi:hypothetical protein